MTGTVRNFRLEPGEWTRLEDICFSLGCLSSRGMNVGLPSVNALLRTLSRGELEVVRKLGERVDSDTLVREYVASPTTAEAAEFNVKLVPIKTEDVVEDSDDLEYDEEFDWGA